MKNIKKTVLATLFVMLFVVAAFAVTQTTFAYVTGGGGTGCTGCGGGNDGGGSTPSTPGGNQGGGDKTPIVPVCTLTAKAATINAGASSKLTWTSKNAVSGTINQSIGDVNPNNTSGYRDVSPAKTITYTLTVKSTSGKTATCAAKVTVVPKPVVPAPTCVLKAAPAEVLANGKSALSWTTQNAISAVINQAVGPVDPKNTTATEAVTVAKTTTYTMTVKNSAGATATCAKTVTVKTVPVPPVIPAPTCVLAGNPSSVVKGQAAKLTWTSTNAVSGVINNAVGVVDPKSTADFRNVSPLGTTEYTMTVKNSAGLEATCKKVITVTNTPNVPAPSCVLFANPQTINRGESARLTWTSVNAVSGSINQAVGVVAVKSTTDFKSVSPSTNTTYTMTVKNSAGVEATCAKAITVNTPNTETFSCANNVNFNASDTSIREGNSTTLSWTTTGATSVRISGTNATALDGSVAVSPRSDTTYTLSATKGNNTINCPLTINVDEDNGGGGGGGSVTPSCKLTISDKNISLGERVTIKWDTSRATGVTLKDNHGNTLIDTDGKTSSGKKELYDGEITLRPEKDTTYTLEASRGSRERTCKVEVDVEDSIVVTQIRDQQPLVTGIALTQVPYTGFEAGPFMTSVFYTLLAAWALYMAYILMGRKAGADVSNFTPARIMNEIVPATAMFPEVVTAAPVFYQAATPVMATTATIGYEAHAEATAAIEAQAHAAHVLLSADAIAYFVAATANEDRTAILSGVLAAAKASYPSEDGWVVVSADRMIDLAAKF